MKGFIEVSTPISKLPLLLAVDSIIAVTESDTGGAFIEIYMELDESSGFSVSESFEEVKEKIKNAI